MEYVPTIIAVLALLVAGFVFYKVSGLVYRLKNLEKKNRELEAGLKAMENHIRRSQKSQPQENNRNARGNQPQLSAPAQPTRSNQPQEARQKQQQPAKGQQQEPRNNQNQQRPPQEPKQRPEGQNQPQRQPREPRQPQEPRQKQGQQPQTAQQPQPQGQGGGAANQNPRQPQQQRRNENRRREPAANAAETEQNSAAQPAPVPTLGKELVGDNLLSELTQQPETPVSRTRYSIIPEDGIIKTHQLQHKPDSDSYLEIDTPADGSASTSYRFNLSGNQAFVISQGMDRLENAFSFEKPSNRMVNRIVQQGDGLLVRTSSGWKIQDKARIDFR
ncbi:hypothetical protein [Rufibacter immobilis]|uniref:hypothetical protein n=1 Tax=Rufibacter immobilis TaxID=1348778 RepID=UPI0011CDB09C|nr:hypothetical protein [Rufibacter immobilis]